ncbi:hypothetical protein BU25DRAFT_420603 [Macroventuria anomochaeta]|uniref:Uncharacterized protein n=1 Tax=Macroventuria anomochaeta TaxID=301207 RepID=A0ACB6S3U8_9PLEO|nr:uncharacterized protein BU25DRAFT_420603 [Macroventuria anomochaeta]KAF2628633.1 hypothetical protein BU25DRAFT_420603 [Macroventuria anomochaeta]
MTASPSPTTATAVRDCNKLKSKVENAIVEATNTKTQLGQIQNDLAIAQNKLAASEQKLATTTDQLTVAKKQVIERDQQMLNVRAEVKKRKKTDHAWEPPARKAEQAQLNKRRRNLLEAGKGSMILLLPAMVKVKVKDCKVREVYNDCRSSCQADTEVRNKAFKADRESFKKITDEYTAKYRTTHRDLQASYKQRKEEITMHEQEKEKTWALSRGIKMLDQSLKDKDKELKPAREEAGTAKKQILKMDDDEDGEEAEERKRKGGGDAAGSEAKKAKTGKQDLKECFPSSTC